MTEELKRKRDELSTDYMIKNDLSARDEIIYREGFDAGVAAVNEKLDKAHRKLMCLSRRRRGGLAGQAFTNYTCFRCDSEECHGDTNTPLFCRDCESYLQEPPKEGK